jgi:hypothetical protein
MLEQSNLELQLFVGFGKLPCSFRNPPIEFACSKFLFTEEQCGGGLNRGNAKNQSLGLFTFAMVES